MRILRAIWAGILLWILILLEVSALILWFKIPETSSTYFVTHFIFLTLFTILISLYYFWHRNIKPGFGHGILLGIVMIITLIILDTIITIPVWMNFDYGFLIRPNIMIGELLVLIVATVIGAIKA